MITNNSMYAAKIFLKSNEEFKIVQDYLGDLMGTTNYVFSKEFYDKHERAGTPIPSFSTVAVFHVKPKTNE